MKKIDLHIHTLHTFSDSPFEFSLDAFKTYVSASRLDAVAVTNHDCFDAQQFAEIQKSLNAIVFPGIEINVEDGHLLVMANPSDVSAFAEKCGLVSNKIRKIGDSISFEELEAIFGDLDKYLLIPHYEKGPAITGSCLERIKKFTSAGEVDSAKKFVRAIKDKAAMTPVLFSDARIREGMPIVSSRHTFIDCGELSIPSLKACLRDKSKVALSESDGNSLWQVLPSGQKLSTGLNVVLGARSSGKTHLLDEISSAIENVKYIKQFSLVQQNEAAYERDFQGSLERKKSAFSDEYLLGFKGVVEEVSKIDLDASERDVATFLETLLKAASEADRKDSFSKSALFDETEIPVGNAKTLQDLIESVRQVIENVEFRATIEKHVQLSSLRALACDLIQQFWAKNLENEKRVFVNALVKEIRRGLKVRTAAVQIEQVDLYKTEMDRRRVRRFEEIAGYLKTDRILKDESVQGFRIEARRERFGGAGELKALSGVKTAFSEAFKKYDSPYEYLQVLLSNENLPRSDLYRFFAKINYKILNRLGFEVSGGERSEFRLLQEIADAQNFDVLLVDEPESSFDNLFLRSDVNQLLKSISERMPVVVVTHNSTVGASVGADYVHITMRELEDGKLKYRVYSGYPTDKDLLSIDGKLAGSFEMLMNTLEAGDVAYEGRRRLYEAIRR